jgi:hypothetical protein
VPALDAWSPEGFAPSPWQEAVAERDALKRDALRLVPTETALVEALLRARRAEWERDALARDLAAAKELLRKIRNRGGIASDTYRDIEAALSAKGE